MTWHFPSTAGFSHDVWLIEPGAFERGGELFAVDRLVLGQRPDIGGQPGPAMSPEQMKDMPFDMKRMVYGGFKAVVE